MQAQCQQVSDLPPLPDRTYNHARYIYAAKETTPRRIHLDVRESESPRAEVQIPGGMLQRSLSLPALLHYSPQAAEISLADTSCITVVVPRLHGTSRGRRQSDHLAWRGALEAARSTDLADFNLLNRRQAFKTDGRAVTRRALGVLGLPGDSPARQCICSGIGGICSRGCDGLSWVGQSRAPGATAEQWVLRSRWSRVVGYLGRACCGRLVSHLRAVWGRGLTCGLDVDRHDGGHALGGGEASGREGQKECDLHDSIEMFKRVWVSQRASV